MKKWCIVLVCLTGFFSCEKNIELHPDLQEPKLVVEAQIENNLGPIVVLSTSIDYFSTIDPTVLNDMYVHNAKVTVTSGTRSFQLGEIKVPSGNNSFFYYYSINSTSLIFGELGKTYGLKIETGGKTYTATTTIPLLAKKVDSLWWKKAPNNPDTAKVVLMARVTDPPGYGNYIRYYTKVNRDDYYPGRNSVYDDQIIDGVTYDIQLDRGVNKNDILNTDEYGFFKRGDTVTVRQSNIDKATFDFWRTWEFSYQSIGNPFSTPGKVIGNISNGALGSFCGYAAQYKTLIIPK